MAKKTRKFKTEVQQLLDLVIHSLYSKKEIFLRELISNASDAIDRAAFEALTQKDIGPGEGGWKIKLTPDKEAKTLTLSDNGIGIPSGQTDRIFGVFERLPGQASIPGTGIGLAIVRRGLERIGGAAGVERRESGSAFWIEVPHEPTWESWYSMQKPEGSS